MQEGLILLLTTDTDVEVDSRERCEEQRTDPPDDPHSTRHSEV